MSENRESQLSRLSRPFPDKYVESDPSSGAAYVPHPIVNQALLATVGPFSLNLVDIIRGDVGEVTRKKNTKDEYVVPAKTNVVCGVVMRLTCIIDGVQVEIEEAGECEDPHNWQHDGQRMKVATSDCLKRCSMRLGLGLSLWTKHPEQYFLHESLAKRERGGVPVAASTPDRDEALALLLDAEVRLGQPRQVSMDIAAELFGWRTAPEASVQMFGRLSGEHIDRVRGALEDAYGPKV